HRTAAATQQEGRDAVAGGGAGGVGIGSLGEARRETEIAGGRSRFGVIGPQQPALPSKAERVGAEDASVFDGQDVALESRSTRIALLRIAQRVVVRGCDSGKDQVIRVGRNI